MSWLSWLLDTTPFTPRRECGDWSEGHLLTAQAAGAVLAFSFFAIPASLLVVWLVRKRERAPYHWMSLLFAAFIFLCGLTYACQVVAFHWPAYRLFTAVTVLAAAFSATTAALLPGMVYQLMVDAATRRAEELLRANPLAVELVAERARRREAEVSLEAERSLSNGLHEALEELRRKQKVMSDAKVLEAVESVQSAVMKAAEGGP